MSSESKRTTVLFDATQLDRARQLGINVSEVARDALTAAIDAAVTAQGLHWCIGWPDGPSGAPVAFYARSFKGHPLWEESVSATTNGKVVTFRLKDGGDPECGPDWTMTVFDSPEEWAKDAAWAEPEDTSKLDRIDLQHRAEVNKWVEEVLIAMGPSRVRVVDL